LRNLIWAEDDETLVNGETYFLYQDKKFDSDEPSTSYKKTPKIKVYIDTSSSRYSEYPSQLEFDQNSTIKNLKDKLNEYNHEFEIFYIIYAGQNKSDDTILIDNTKYYIGDKLKKITGPQDFIQYIEYYQSRNSDKYESITSIDKNKIIMTPSGNFWGKYLMHKWNDFTDAQRNDVQTMLSKKYNGVKFYTNNDNFVFYHEQNLIILWSKFIESDDIVRRMPDIQQGPTVLLNKILLISNIKDEPMKSIMHVLYNDMGKGPSGYGYIPQDQLDYHVSIAYASYLSEQNSGKKYKLIKK